MAILDNVDLLLLQQIGENPGLSFVEMTKITFKSIGTIQTRIKGLQQRGFIIAPEKKHRSARITDLGVQVLREHCIYVERPSST